MRTPRPALRMALLAVGAAVAAAAGIAAYFGWLAHAYGAAQDRATTVVDGVVVEDEIGDNEDIRVRWVEHTGREHVQRFGIYDIDKYVQGHTFPVAYDPSDPSPKGFPADPYETSAEDDLFVPIPLSGIGTGVLVLAWAVRGLLFRRAARRPGHPMVAWALCGEFDGAPPFPLGNSLWMALAERGEPATPTRWQRVMWHPVMGSMVGKVDVVVHGDPAARRRVVIALPDGARLVPVGRLRRRPPKRILLEDHADVRTGLDSLILPAGAPLPPARPWWRRALVFAAVGAAAGSVLGFLTGGGGVAVLPLAAGMSALLVNGWALTGAEP